MKYKWQQSKNFSHFFSIQECSLKRNEKEIYFVTKNVIIKDNYSNYCINMKIKRKIFIKIGEEKKKKGCKILN